MTVIDAAIGVVAALMVRITASAVLVSIWRRALESAWLAIGHDATQWKQYRAGLGDADFRSAVLREDPFLSGVIVVTVGLLAIAEVQALLLPIGIIVLATFLAVEEFRFGVQGERQRLAELDLQGQVDRGTAMAYFSALLIDRVSALATLAFIALLLVALMS